MNAYADFAQVYDLFMDNVPYKAWCAYICAVLREHKIMDGPVLDLGCGTGELTRRMAAQGYDMTGVDASMEMLQEALSRQADSEILYLLQKMQDLDLDGCVRAAYSACDCVNYVLEPAELLETFCRVHGVLEPGGIFLFDMNTDYKYRTLLGEQTFAESRKEGSFIWENYYDDEERINEYDLTLFIPEEDGLYRRCTETHYQRNYGVEQVKELLLQAGFTLLGVYDDYTREPLRPDSERATFVVCK
jgi:2-polyprenyl-3-methyl-5-hydroxy-6-metoxy-1,4-benzoquinol methylase